MNFLLDFLWEILADRGIYCLNLEVLLKLNQNDTTQIPQEFSDVYFSIAKLPHKLLAVPLLLMRLKIDAVFNLEILQGLMSLTIEPFSV